MYLLILIIWVFEYNVKVLSQWVVLREQETSTHSLGQDSSL